MKLTRTILLLIAFAASATVAHAQEPPPTPPIADYNPKAWQEFLSPEGRFSVLLPGVPRKKVEQADSPTGKIDLHMFTFRTSNQSPQYNLMFIDFSESLDMSDVKAIFDNVREDGVKAVKGKLLEEREDGSTGHPGRFYRVLTGDEGMMMIKAFLVKNRFYNLSYTTGTKTETVRMARLHEEAAARFLNSFRLLSEQELAKFEGEVDKLLKSLREKGEPVLGRCSGAEDCKSTSDATLKLWEPIGRPEPAYPAIAKAARAQGEVRVMVIVSEEGKVIAAQALSGHPLLQSVAVKAARQALFRPTLLNGKPVKISGVLSYNFVLQ